MKEMRTPPSAAARPANPRRAAFSLVEVTLALGIVSVSLVSLIGLLPAGLGVLRDSMDETVRAQILQRVASELATSDFASVGNRSFIVDEGGLIAGGNGAGGARYLVTLDPLDPSLPGIAGDTELADFGGHLKRVRISIARSDIRNAPAFHYAMQVASN